LEWTRGTQLILPPIGNQTTKIVSNERVLAKGRVGRFNGRMGVLVNEVQEKGAKSILNEIGGQSV
jgi:flagellar motor switch/type III secretory pathway protein FliN